ncbi:thiamine pyrophosphate dependent pyruvate decarboxylase family protein [Actinidia rufa]|uniref:Thiamine pyrophosphate dependent pyruvate decarboxylase family protein n=1 Tax=Actinidia rufa TaxID=165716 RepID=A0A7J0EKL9_9ERIC|nr:thiamine pyrophosphate dependent pyruvate decarboxylase family protein [Actinidia rufa]
MSKSGRVGCQWKLCGEVAFCQRHAVGISTDRCLSSELHRRDSARACYRAIARQLSQKWYLIFYPLTSQHTPKGFYGGDLVELWKITSAVVALVRGAGDQDHGPSVGEAGDGEDDAGAAGEVGGGLLVVEGDEADAEGDGAVGEGGDGDSDHAN